MQAQPCWLRQLEMALSSVFMVHNLQSTQRHVLSMECHHLSRYHHATPNIYRKDTAASSPGVLVMQPIFGVRQMFSIHNDEIHCCVIIRQLDSII